MKRINKTVVLCAGHGGKDPGAVYRNTTEAKQTADITARVAKILRADGRLKVVVVPPGKSLVAKISWVNKSYGSLYSALAVEIHKNTGGGNGSEVWLPTGADNLSRSIGTKINKALAKATGQPNRGNKNAMTSRFGKLGWTDDIKCYSVLVEAGFIDVNPNGAKANAKYASGIAQGLLDAWGLKPKPKPKPSTPKPPAKPKPSNKVPAAVKLGTKLRFTTRLNPTNVWDITSGPSWRAVAKLDKGAIFTAYARIQLGNSLYYVTEYSYKNKIKAGINAVDLALIPEFKPPAKPTEPPKPVKPSKDDEQDARLSAIEAIIKTITDFLTSVFSGFKGGK